MMRLHDSNPAWVRVAVFVGLLYTAVGIGFAIPHTHVRFWRLAAWVVCAAAYAAHLGYEHFRLGHAPRSVASHVAAAAALGGFGMAVGANVHSLSIASTDQHHRLLLIALVVWPLILAVPSFVIGLGISGSMSHFRRSARME